MMMIVEHLVEWELAGKRKYSEKICPSATLSAANPTWPDLGSKPGRRGGKPAFLKFTPSYFTTFYMKLHANEKLVQLD
jgi:hypothetical protein